jgi:hypothetical protein
LIPANSLDDDEEYSMPLDPTARRSSTISNATSSGSFEDDLDDDADDNESDDANSSKQPAKTPSQRDRRASTSEIDFTKMSLNPMGGSQKIADAVDSENNASGASNFLANVNTDIGSGLLPMDNVVILASCLNIGTWRRISVSKDDLVCILSPTEAVLRWTIVESGFSFRIDIPITSVVDISLESINNTSNSYLHIDINSTPIFQKEIRLASDPSSQSLFVPCDDFTENVQASICTRHTLQGASASLELAFMALSSHFKNASSLQTAPLTQFDALLNGSIPPVNGTDALFPMQRRMSAPTIPMFMAPVQPQQQQQQHQQRPRSMSNPGVLEDIAEGSGEELLLGQQVQVAQDMNGFMAQNLQASQDMGFWM